MGAGTQGHGHDREVQRVDETEVDEGSRGRPAAHDPDVAIARRVTGGTERSGRVVGRGVFCAVDSRQFTARQHPGGRARVTPRLALRGEPAIGARAHDDRADADEKLVVLLLEVIETEVEQPVEGTVAVGDESVETLGDVVDSRTAHSARLAAASDTGDRRWASADAADARVVERAAEDAL